MYGFLRIAVCFSLVCGFSSFFCLFSYFFLSFLSSFPSFSLSRRCVSFVLVIGAQGELMDLCTSRGSEVRFSYGLESLG